jgi:hypothetical protein
MNAEVSTAVLGVSGGSRSSTPPSCSFERSPGSLRDMRLWCVAETFSSRSSNRKPGVPSGERSVAMVSPMRTCSRHELMP